MSDPKVTMVVLVALFLETSGQPTCYWSVSNKPQPKKQSCTNIPIRANIFLLELATTVSQEIGSIV